VAYLPAITAVVAAIFALVVLRQYGNHRRTYQLMWATGFAMFAIAAFAGFLAQSGGATETEYRLFYLFGAILNVAWLALGTMYLLARRRWADGALVVVVLLSLAAAYAVVAAPVDLVAATAGHPAYPNGSLYITSKFAVRGFTYALREDLLGRPIRITTVDPGAAETEFSLVRYKGDAAQAAANAKGFSAAYVRQITR